MSAAKHRARAAKARNVILPAMASKWPRCFSIDERRRKPLKLGIARDLFTASARGLASGALTKAEIHAALRRYTGGRFYLAACKAGAPRIDLAGKQVGCVSAAEARFARAEIEKRNSDHQQKQKLRHHSGTGASHYDAHHHSPAA